MRAARLKIVRQRPCRRRRGPAHGEVQPLKRRAPFKGGAARMRAISYKLGGKALFYENIHRATDRIFASEHDVAVHPRSIFAVRPLGEFPLCGS